MDAVSMWLEFWVRLGWNLLGYMTLVVPVSFLIVYYKRRSESLSGQGAWQQFLRLFVFGQGGKLPDTDPLAIPSKDRPLQEPRWIRLTVLFGCFVGLLFNYVLWGFLQEKIMTTMYILPRRLPSLTLNRSMSWTAFEEGERFRNSQFLVLVSRVVALVLSVVVLALRWTKQPRHAAPLYLYAYPSMANILSSWCQYEALKYISFPTQVLGKASKMVAVMLVGACVRGKTYPRAQYVSAIAISVGVILFLMPNPESALKQRPGAKRLQTGSTNTLGFLLMIGYVGFDSVTTNVQKRLFDKHAMSSLQMMAGVNLVSSALTLVSEVESGSFWESIAFVRRHSDFVWDTTLFSACSAMGNFIIYYTIRRFGALSFTIMMTVRQVCSIVLSCLYYGHPISAVSSGGILIVFGALLVHAGLQSRK